MCSLEWFSSCTLSAQPAGVSDRNTKNAEEHAYAMIYSGKAAKPCSASRWSRRNRRRRARTSVSSSLGCRPTVSSFRVPGVPARDSSLRGRVRSQLRDPCPKCADCAPHRHALWPCPQGQPQQFPQLLRSCAADYNLKEKRVAASPYRPIIRPSGERVFSDQAPTRAAPGQGCTPPLGAQESCSRFPPESRSRRGGGSGTQRRRVALSASAKKIGLEA